MKLSLITTENYFKRLMVNQDDFRQVVACLMVFAALQAFFGIVTEFLKPFKSLWDPGVKFTASPRP